MDNEKQGSWLQAVVNVALFPFVSLVVAAVLVWALSAGTFAWLFGRRDG